MILKIVEAIVGIIFIVMGGYVLSDGQAEWQASASLFFLGLLFLIYGLRDIKSWSNLAPAWMQFDKVRFVVIGSFFLLALLVFSVWITLPEWLQHSEPTWLVFTITLSAALGIFLGWFVNPMISYQRNSDICVGGIPFPVHYGMPVEGGCISGHFVPRNFFLDICYFCLVFIAMGLLVYTTGAKYGFITSLITASFLLFVIRVFLLNVLKIYPIRIEA